MDPQERRRTSMLATINRLAIVQLVLGILCLINGIAIVAFYQYAIIIVGGAIEIWTVLFFLVAGALGIGATSRGRINVHMAFCIVASVMAFILFSEATYFAAPKRSYMYYVNRYHVSFSWPHIPLAIFALIEFIISIISAATCCRAECCRSTPGAVIAQPQHVVVYPSAYTGPQQGVVIAQHPTAYPTQPTQMVAYSGTTAWTPANQQPSYTGGDACKATIPQPPPYSPSDQDKY